MGGKKWKNPFKDANNASSFYQQILFFFFSFLLLPQKSFEPLQRHGGIHCMLLVQYINNCLRNWGRWIRKRKKKPHCLKVSSYTSNCVPGQVAGLLPWLGFCPQLWKFIEVVIKQQNLPVRCKWLFRIILNTAYHFILACLTNTEEIVKPY